MIVVHKDTHHAIPAGAYALTSLEARAYARDANRGRAMVDNDYVVDGQRV